MYQKKVSKREKRDNSLVQSHDNILLYTRNHDSEYWQRDHYIILSIDPGSVSFGIRLEKRLRTQIIPLEAPGSYKPIGKGITIYMRRWILAENDQVPMNIRRGALYERLDWLFTSVEYSSYIRNCSIFIIESQLAINYKAIRIQEMTQSYIFDRFRHYSHAPYLLEVEPTVKTSGMQAPRGLNDTDLKRWSVEVGEIYYEHWGDQLALQVSQAESQIKKGDDVNDTLHQIEGVLLHYKHSRDHLPTLDQSETREQVSMKGTDLSFLMPVRMPPKAAIKPASSWSGVEERVSEVDGSTHITLDDL